MQVDPITGDIELTYRYPAYMRRDPRTLSGTGGEIRAPKGTDVELRTRADRVVAAAEIVVDLEVDPSARPAAAAAPQGTGAGPAAVGDAADGGALGAAPAPPTTPAAQPKAAPGPPVARRYVLAVTDGRDLHGTFPVVEGGSYRFRFYDAKNKLLAEGPPIPIVIEPDAYPTVQITAPDKEVEVEPTASVEIVWQAEDDIALGEVNLVLKPPQGEEKRIALRSGDPVRRDSGGYRLAVGPLQLGEGERLSYRVEAADTDTVSGPKVSSSDTRFIRIYSEAEHRRQMLERARQAYEELVASLGDRLDLHVQGQVNTEERLPQAQSVDARTRLMTDHLRLAARDLRRDPGRSARGGGGARERGPERPLRRGGRHQQPLPAGHGLPPGQGIARRAAPEAGARRDEAGPGRGRARRRQRRAGLGEGDPLPGAAPRQAPGRGPGQARQEPLAEAARPGRPHGALPEGADRPGQAGPRGAGAPHEGAGPRPALAHGRARPRASTTST